MTTPALLRLREKFPDAHIVLLTPEKLRELWLRHPAVNETISLAPGEGLVSVARKLRGGNFDLALILPNSPRSALEAWLAGIPRRIGHARPWRNWFLTTRIPSRPDAVKMRKRSVAEIKRLIATSTERGTRNTEHAPRPSAHQIHEYLHLAAALGANPEPLPPRLFVAPGEIEAAKRKFGLEKISNPILGLNPGAEYGPAKRWPVERFIAAAREIQKQTDCVWLIFGGQGDVELANRVAAGITHHASRVTEDASQITQINLAGKTSLRELMALLKLCRVLLTNDSGPMHVAAALGTPVVVPFGSTSPELTGPGLPDLRNRRREEADGRGETENPPFHGGGYCATSHALLNAHAPCSPCFRRECPIDFRCMTGISVDGVVEAILKTIEQQRNKATNG